MRNQDPPSGQGKIDYPKMCHFERVGFNSIGHDASFDRRRVDPLSSTSSLGRPRPMHASSRDECSCFQPRRKPSENSPFESVGAASRSVSSLYLLTSINPLFYIELEGNAKTETFPKRWRYGQQARAIPRLQEPNPERSLLEPKHQVDDDVQSRTYLQKF